MPVSDTSQAAKGAFALNIIANAAFVPIGIVTVLLSPMLPILSTRWSLNDSQAGALFTAQFLASTVAVVLSSVLVSRWGYRFAINAGLLAMALGVGALPLSSHLPGLACIASYGFGSGLAVPAANLLVGEVNPHRRSAALSLLNFSWSLGAVACPFLVAAATAAHRIPLLLTLVAAFMLLVVLGIAAAHAHIVEPGASPRRDQRTQLPIRWNERSLLILGALFFLYVGTECAYAGWTAAYAKSLDRMSPALALMIPSFFYFALMLGRWLASLVLRGIDEIKLARAGLLIACAGMAALPISRTMISVMVSVSLAGLGLSAVYPITISLLSRKFGPAASRVGSVMFTLANLGGACLPWLVGFCSARFGNLRVGLAVPLVAGMSMYVLYRSYWEPAQE
jgi:MFS transporter, FHS family, glucose/mannose:H+ symporter